MLENLYQMITGKSPCNMLFSKEDARRWIKEGKFDELKKLKKWLSKQPKSQRVTGALFNISYVEIENKRK